MPVEASSIGDVSGRPPPIQGGFVDWMHDVTDGRRPLPTSDSSRHHYVAQFQLAKFKGKGRLHQLDKEDGACEVVTPKKAAWSSKVCCVVRPSACASFCRAR